MPQPNRFLRHLREISAALAGYVTIIIITIIGFTPLGGIIHLSAPLRIHLLATVVALVAGVLGGIVAAWVGGRSPIRHALGAAAFLALESTLLITLRPSRDPLWFDILGAATLIVATISGGYLWSRVSSQHRALPITGSPSH